MTERAYSFEAFASSTVAFFDTWGTRMVKATAFIKAAQELLEAANALIGSEAFKLLGTKSKNFVFNVKNYMVSTLKQVGAIAKSFWDSFSDFMDYMTDTSTTSFAGTVAMWQCTCPR